MNIFLEEDELIEIKPVSETEDKGIVITPKKEEPKQEISELRKELAAVDAINTTAREAAMLHGIGKTNANRYSNGVDLSPDARANVISLRNGIQDVAIAKLMDTLNLLNPHNVEKERDRVAIMTGLSQVIEKLNPKDSNGDKPTVHLHMYSPVQKIEKDYDVIEA